MHHVYLNIIELIIKYFSSLNCRKHLYYVRFYSVPINVLYGDLYPMNNIWMHACMYFILLVANLQPWIVAIGNIYLSCSKAKVIEIYLNSYGLNFLWCYQSFLGEIEGYVLRFLRHSLNLNLNLITIHMLKIFYDVINLFQAKQRDMCKDFLDIHNMLELV